MYGRNQSVSEISPLESEVAKLIVHTLTLKVDPTRIQPEEPLFGDGVGLDSIDALELSLAISQSYGYQIRSNDRDIVATFAAISPGNPSSLHSYSKTWVSSVTAARSAGARLGLKAFDPITMVATVPQQHLCGLEASVMFPVYSAGDS
jgi:acyl carrier protein